MIRGKSEIPRLRPRLRPLSILERFHVVIAGGGFSGVALAAHLVRHADRGLRITLVDAGERLGRGVAYDTEFDDHLQNSRAADMSALDDEADDFVWWLRRHGHASSGREFVSRRRYGDYLEDKLIETSLRAAQHDIAFSASAGTRVTDVMDGGDAFLVALDDGRSLRCDAVVLATGHDRAGAGRELEQRLLRRGLLLPDALGLGWITDGNGALARRDGSPRRLYLLGPARRPECFESTAVPELRRQAAGLAAELVEAAAARRFRPLRRAEGPRARATVVSLGRR